VKGVFPHKTLLQTELFPAQISTLLKVFVYSAAIQDFFSQDLLKTFAVRHETEVQAIVLMVFTEIFGISVSFVRKTL